MSECYLVPSSQNPDVFALSEAGVAALKAQWLKTNFIQRTIKEEGEAAFEAWFARCVAQKALKQVEIDDAEVLRQGGVVFQWENERTLWERLAEFGDWVLRVGAGGKGLEASTGSAVMRARYSAAWVKPLRLEEGVARLAQEMAVGKRRHVDGRLPRTGVWKMTSGMSWSDRLDQIVFGRARRGALIEQALHLAEVME